MHHAFITDEHRIALLANSRTSLDNPNFDPAPVVKLCTPDGGATWLLTEIDPDDHDHAFGLCDLGLGIRNSAGSACTSWRPCAAAWACRSSAYARDARLAGHITA